MVTKVGGIVIDIDARLAKLEASLAKGQNDFKKFERNTMSTASKIESHVKKAGAAFALLGASIVAAGIGKLAGMTGKALDYAASLGEISQQVGVTVEQLQVYRYAATQVNVSQEEMEKGLARLTVTLGKAQVGSKAETDALKALSDVIGRDILTSARNAGDALPMIADGLSRIESPAKRAAVEVALFGRAGQKLDPLLAQGSKAIAEYGEQARRTGQIISNELSDKADRASDRIAAFNKQMEVNIASVVAENADAILSLVNALAQLVVGAGKAGLAWQDFVKRQQIAQIDRRLSFMGTGVGNNPFLSNEERLALLQSKSDLAGQRLDISTKAEGKETPEERRKRVMADIWRGWGSKGGPAEIGNFLNTSGGGGSSKPKEDPIAEMMKSVDIDIRNTRIEFEDDIHERIKAQLATAEDGWQKVLEIRRDEEEDLARFQERQVSSLANQFEDAFHGGTKSIWDNFKNIGIRVISEVLAKFTLSNINGGGGFNLGSAFSSAIGSIFGGGFASGGRPPMGRISMVGERGPELFVPDQAGTIIPNHMLGANDNVRGGGNATVLNMTINAPGATAETVLRIRQEIASAAPMIVQAATQSTMRTMTRPALGR